MKKILTNKRIIISTGGTGGHIFPAQAIAEKLQEQHYKVHLICDQRALQYCNGIFYSIEKTIVFLSNPKKNLMSKILYVIFVFLSLLKIARKFFYHKPELVISFGGYSSIPASLYAVIFRIPLLLHDQNSVLGRANRILIPFATKVLLGFPIIHKIQSQYHDKVFIIGLPIRIRLLKIIQQNKKISRKKSKILKILIIGGSQGASIFSQVVPNAISSLEKELQRKLYVTQQVRNEDMNKTTNIYNRTACKFNIQLFFKNIEKLYKSHNLIISRAGASSIIEILSFKKAAILVPLSNATDNHQFYNAQYLTKNSKAILREENQFSVKWLASLLKVFIEDKSKINEIEKSYNKDILLLHSDSISKFLNQVNSLINH